MPPGVPFNAPIRVLTEASDCARALISPTSFEVAVQLMADILQPAVEGIETIAQLTGAVEHHQRAGIEVGSSATSLTLAKNCCSVSSIPAAESATRCRSAVRVARRPQTPRTTRCSHERA